MAATKQTIAVLLGYLTCDDPVIKTKYENLLASFWHKDEGLIIKTVADDGSGGTDITFSDDSVVNFPVLPSSKPISFITGLLDALNTKVDKVVGKQLSEEDFTTAFKNKLDNLSNYVHPTTHLISEIQDLQDILDGKVDKVAGKKLSTNDLTDELVQKINALNPISGSKIIRGGFAVLPNRIIRIFIYEYIINDVYYDTPIIGDVQLDIGGAQDRADTIAINNSAQAIVKKGIEGDPSPPDVDLTTELQVTWRYIKAGATEPDGSTFIYIFNENAGQPTEWDATENTAGARINLNGSSNPSDGLISITATQIQNLDAFHLQVGTPVTLNPDGLIQFKINLQTVWTDNEKFWVLLYDVTRIHTNFITIKNGSYGFDGTLLNQQQIIAIPLSDYDLTSLNLKLIQFFFLAGGKDFSIDEIQLFDSSNQPITDTTITTTISRTSQIPINDGNTGESPYAEVKDIKPYIEAPGISIIEDTTKFDVAIKFPTLPVIPPTANDFIAFMGGTDSLVSAITPLNTFPLSLFLNDLGILSGELNLPAYPNTRDDGQLPTNRVLGTDATGNLKMYTIATAPAPYLEVVIPDSYLPSTSGNFKLIGAFFTPDMTISFGGGAVVNNINFISDNEVDVTVTTGATEGSYAITLNNGLEAIFYNALLIVLGDVFSPAAADWGSITGNIDVSNGNDVEITLLDTLGTAIWNKTIDLLKDFTIEWIWQRSPLDPLGTGRDNYIRLIDITTGTSVLNIKTYNDGGVYIYDTDGLVVKALNGYSWNNNISRCQLKFISGALYYYVDDILKHTFSVNQNALFVNNLNLQVDVIRLNTNNIKYIEHP